MRLSRVARVVGMREHGRWLSRSPPTHPAAGGRRRAARDACGTCSRAPAAPWEKRLPTPPPARAGPLSTATRAAREQHGGGVGEVLVRLVDSPKPRAPDRVAPWLGTGRPRFSSPPDDDPDAIVITTDVGRTWLADTVAQ